MHELISISPSMHTPLQFSVEPCSRNCGLGPNVMHVVSLSAGKCEWCIHVHVRVRTQGGEGERERHTQMQRDRDREVETER